MHVTSLIAHRNLIFLLLVEIRTSYVLYVCYIILLAWITKLMCLKNVMKDFTIICRIYRSVRLISHHNVNIPSYTENCDSEKLHVFSKRYKVNIMGFIIEGEVESNHGLKILGGNFFFRMLQKNKTWTCLALAITYIAFTL